MECSRETPCRWPPIPYDAGVDQYSLEPDPTPPPQVPPIHHAPPVEPRLTVEATTYTCRKCRFNLTGLTIGGQCPECGTPVVETLRAGGLETSQNAIVGLVLGIVSILVCGLVAPFAIWMFYRTKSDVAEGRAAPTSMTMAIVGLVLGIVAILINGVSAAIFLAILVAS